MTAPTSAGPPDVLVRELRWSDFDDVREAYWLLYEEREVRPDVGITLFRNRPSYADEVAWFADLFRRAASGEAIVTIGERAGHAVGHCTVRRVGPTPDSESAHVGELGILVHRDHRGRGVGRAILERALAECAGTFEIVRLSVFATNVRARTLYEALGFVRAGTIPRAVRRGTTYYDEELMVRRLEPPVTNR